MKAFFKTLSVLVCASSTLVQVVVGENSPIALYPADITGSSISGALESPEVVAYEAAVGYQVGIAIGGVNDEGAITQDVRLYFPEQDVAIKLSNMQLPFKLRDFAAVVYNDYLYVIGGYDDSGYYNTGLFRLNLGALGIAPGGSAETLDQGVSWEFSADYSTFDDLPDYGGDGMESYGYFSVKNNYHLVNNLLYVIGPRTNDGSSTSGADYLFAFDLDTQRWLTEAELGNAVDLPVSATGPTTSYDPATGTFYLLPGYEGSALSQNIYAKLISASGWSVLSSQVNYGRMDASMVSGPNGSLALVGGYDPSSGAISRFEYYVPGSSWAEVFGAEDGTQGIGYNEVSCQFMCFAVSGSAAVSLGNGNFFIASANDAGLESAYRSAADIVVEQPAGTGLTAAESTVEFGSVAVDSYVERTFTIRNVGFTSLTSISASLSGTDASDFSIESVPATSIAYDGTTTLIVRFTPQASGERVASLSITSNDADEASFDISLSGMGSAPIDTWLGSYFTESELADSEVSGLDVDIEHDGIVNGIEYMLGLDPKNAEPQPWSVALVKPESIQYLSMQIDLPEDLPADGTITVVDTDSLKSPIVWRTLASKTGAGEWIEHNGGAVIEGSATEGQVPTEIRSPNTVGALDSDPAGFMQIQFAIDQP